MLTRAILVCVLSVVPALAAALSDADLITEALLPLHDQLRNEAAVVTMDAHGQRRVIREGKTALTCTPDGPDPGFYATCINGSTGNVIQAYTSHLARGASIREARDAVNAAIGTGSLTTATPGTLSSSNLGQAAPSRPS